MELLISISADGFAKNDRVVAKVGRGEWLQGVIQTSGKNLKIVFDDRSSATVGPEDFKDVKPIVAKTKKIKDVMTAAEAKILIAAYKLSLKQVKPLVKASKVAATKTVKTPKTSKADPLKPKKAAKQDGGKQDHDNQTAKRTVQKVVEKTVRKADIQKKSSTGGKAGLPPPGGRYPQEGYVFTNSRLGECIVTSINQGRSITHVHYTQINPLRKGKPLLYNAKVRNGYGRFGLEYPGMTFTYLRKASQAELDLAHGSRKVLEDAYQARTDKNKDAHQILGIRPGDKVMVNYTNGSKVETVTDINYKTGKAAIWTRRDVIGKKRRFIHIQNISAVTEKGPGHFTPPVATPGYLGKPRNIFGF